MKATRKYFFVVIGLMLLQIAMGVDHRALRGRRPVVLRHAARAGPAYVVSRTIHTQIGIFWIATAWLATGLYVAPLLSRTRAEAAEARRRRARSGR
jgi:nitric oxide reductase subunit B